MAAHYAEDVDSAAVMALLDPYVSSSLGLTYDPAHARVGKQDPVAAVRTIGAAIRHVHLSDNDGSVDQHRPLGTGTIDFPAVLSEFHEIGYCGALELELGQHEEYLVSRDYLQQRHAF